MHGISIYSGRIFSVYIGSLVLCLMNMFITWKFLSFNKKNCKLSFSFSLFISGNCDVH